MILNYEGWSLDLDGSKIGQILFTRDEEIYIYSDDADYLQQLYKKIELLYEGSQPDEFDIEGEALRLWWD